MSGSKFAVIVLACNEDNVLGRCLESCAGLEVHVSIDRKTTDGSRAVAESYGATLYEHEFLNNSWADTRNDVMNRVEAASDAEWFAWLDADEWWLAGRDLIPQALAAAEKHDAQGVTVTLRDHAQQPDVVSGQWLNVKILRRGLRYERRRHEVVPASTVRVQAAEIVIGHRKGQRAEVFAANERLKHDLDALLADFDEFGDRRSAYYVADAHQAAGRWWDAVAWYRLGLSLPDDQVGIGLMLHEGLAQTYRRMGRPAEAREVTRQLLLGGRPGFGEVCFDLGADSHNLRDAPEAEFWLRMAIAAGDQPRTSGIGHPDKTGCLAYYSLAMSKLCQGKFLEAAAYLGKAKELGSNPKFDELEQMIYAEGAKAVTADAVVPGE